MDGNWIKLYRTSLDSVVFADSKLWHLWTFLLMRANYKQRTLPDGTTLNPGQLVTSNNTISDRLGVSKSTANRLLKRLVRVNKIARKAERRRTIVTICNWGTYNDEKQKGGTIAERWRNDSGTIVEPKEERKKEKNISKSAEMGFPHASKPVENNNRSGTPYTAEFDAFWKIWPPLRRNHKRRAFAEFKRAKQRTSVAAIMDAAEAFAKSQKGRGEFCPMPSTWLSGDGWDDDPQSWNTGDAPAFVAPRKADPEQERQRALFREFQQLQRQRTQSQKGTAEWQRLSDRIEALREVIR